MISATGLSLLVGTALLVAVCAPCVLLALVIKDWREGRLW